VTTNNPEITPEMRSLLGRAMSHESWSRTTDRSARTAPGRAAALSRFERQVDPLGILPEAERLQRAEHAKKAHFTRMAYLSAAARRARKAQKQQDDAS
jgi:hypothetical protein